jgi:hypothetical protein
VVPLTVQVVGVQESNVTARALVALAVSVWLAPEFTVGALNVKLIVWPKTPDVLRLVVVPSPSWPYVFGPQHFTPPAVVSAQV